MFDTLRFDSDGFDSNTTTPIILITNKPPLTLNISRTVNYYGNGRIVAKSDSLSTSPTLILLDGDINPVVLDKFVLSASLCEYTNYKILKNMSVNKLAGVGNIEVNLDTTDIDPGYYMLHISARCRGYELTAPSNGYIPVTIT